MESLSETVWDVVICGTGLSQSLLALSLSRSDKKVLHIDPNDFYGGSEAALSLQESEDWAKQHEAPSAAAAPSGAPAESLATSIFTSARVTKPEDGVGLSFARAYSLALAPQLVHARSQLVTQLVSSRAFRQLEFLAVGSFFVLARRLPDDEAAAGSPHKLTRIPSTREDVFSDDSIPARAKRSLMKFLKFVLDYNSDTQTELWREDADRPLAGFLERRFKLDQDLRAYVLTLTLSPDGAITTKDGLVIIHRHLTSMGYFGPGFAAVYPKWGGAGEIAQVACRAGAVGGGVYMLGTGIANMRTPSSESADDGEILELDLTNGTTVKTKLLVRGREEVPVTNHEPIERVSRLVAVVNSPLTSIFDTVVEGAPIPAVAVIACPPQTLDVPSEAASQDYPVYALVHSSDTGECPPGQTVIYLSTHTTAHAQQILEQSLTSVLAAINSTEAPRCLYQVYYEQSSTSSAVQVDGRIVTLPAPSPALAVSDEILDSVHDAWRAAMGPEAQAHEDGYMKFVDREVMDDDDDV
ncbi:rab protein geranylgeranyltransferase component A [Gaeumannomyces tritici R3-111a-1]|uniref:Rab proteins geranylgeranyltransferase n=1 Tax=Gaeumannomyces tritici (strain R3-111a-1) TaxID=644352 RepID=J3PDB3_GAET3|nr:rab protein geranylgeranyltransferase component A [Gaeumannomyces tritici R3-111a-1]EJT70458.1 rab protein geranylgeranyltransferase component A [Gaeumannomyces tritici R3-111a-1]